MKENSITYKSIRVERNKYCAPRPKRRFSINVSDKLCVVNHKNRWVVALTHYEGWRSYFYGHQTINRSQALLMIQFLTDYVNLVKPTDATKLNASIKVSANRVLKNNTELTAMALNEELKK